MSLLPQRIDFLQFPVEFVFCLPQWMADDGNDANDSSRVVIGGGSGVKHGHPYVMSVFEYKINSGMNKFRQDPHIESVLEGVTHPKHIQGRLNVSCERRCIDGTFLQSNGCGSTTILIGSSSWTNLNNVSKKKWIPIITSRDGHIDLYILDLKGKFKFINTQDTLLNIDSPKTKAEYIELLSMECLANGFLVISSINRKGYLTVWQVDISNDFGSFKLVYDNHLELNGAEPTDMCILSSQNSELSDLTIVVAFGKSDIVLTKLNDGKSTMLAIDDKIMQGGLNKRDPTGMVAKFVRRIDESSQKTAGSLLLISGYYSDPTLSRKKSRRHCYVAIVSLDGSLTAITKWTMWMDKKILNVSDVECVPIEDTGGRLASNEILFCFTTKNDTQILRVKLSSNYHTYSLKKYIVGLPNVTDPCFPPRRIVYLKSLNACLVTWSNYTSALVDMIEPRRRWSLPELILFYGLILSIMVYVVYFMDVDQKRLVWTMIMYYLNMLKIVGKKFTLQIIDKWKL